MPGGVARLGDIFATGGIITPPVSTGIFVNGRPAALFGAGYTPHLCCGQKKCPPTHCFGTIGDVPVGVFFDGSVPLTKTGVGLCGHKVQTASADVFVVGGGLGASLAGLVAGRLLS